MTARRGSLVGRVLHEHRAWVWPLAILLGLNGLALSAGILPMSRGVASAEGRATAASADAAAAATELAAAAAARDGRATATRELATFHADVLPGGVAEARRLLQLKVAQLARAHDVTFARSVATPEAIRDSDLARLRASIELVGRYRDVRRFLYELETSKDFVVVDSIVLSEGDDAAAPLNLTLAISTFFKAGPDVH
jgi:Type II secretion system (T2SS), protein M subtype b